MDIRRVLLIVEYMGEQVEDEDVKVILREVWSELKLVEKEMGVGRKERV